MNLPAYSLHFLSSLCLLSAFFSPHLAAQPMTSVARAHAELAFANYHDTVIDAQKLQTAVKALLDQPSNDTLQAAKKAWLAARESYGQSEVLRFRGGPIDDNLSTPEANDGPEGHINAWPLAESLIDYVALEVDGLDQAESADAAQHISDNIVADSRFVLSKDHLAANNELGGDEANVTTGYHAIEFLLWGQDLNQDGSGSGKRDNSAGQRPYTDYAKGDACTHQHCERRGQYLSLAVALLVEHLQSVAAQWHPKTGAHYATFSALSDAEAAAKILEGMGRLSYGELAGERMNIALMTDSQEDEQSCFSDNTHRDIVSNAQGIQNVYLAHYAGKSYGNSIYAWLQKQQQGILAEKLKQQLLQTMKAVALIDKAAKAGVPFDNQIQGSDAQKQIIINAIVALRHQTHSIEKIMSVVNMQADLRQDTEQNIETQ